MQAEILMFFERMGNPFLDQLFMMITNLGSESFYVLIITMIFWCTNKKLGAKLFVVTMVAAHVNTLLKEFFHTQRPIYHEGINSLYIESAPGYSFPSGHTQGATTFWFYLIRKIRDKKVSYIGWTIILLVGLSRLYLRVHWPIDVVGGLVFGIVSVYLLDFIIEKVIRLKLNYTTTILLAIILPHLLLMTHISETSIKMTALLTGALIGFFTEERLIDFKEKNTLTKQVLKYILGVGIFLTLKSGLKLVFPEVLFFEYLRYFILGIWTTLIAPYIFIKLRLADRY